MSHIDDDCLREVNNDLKVVHASEERQRNHRVIIIAQNEIYMTRLLFPMFLFARKKVETSCLRNATEISNGVAI